MTFYSRSYTFYIHFIYVLYRNYIIFVSPVTCPHILLHIDTTYVYIHYINIAICDVIKITINWWHLGIKLFIEIDVFIYCIYAMQCIKYLLHYYIYLHIVFTLFLYIFFSFLNCCCWCFRIFRYAFAMENIFHYFCYLFVFVAVANKYFKKVWM